MTFERNPVFLLKLSVLDVPKVQVYYFETYSSPFNDMESKPSNVFKVTEFAILITALVSDPTHVIINA